MFSLSLACHEHIISIRFYFKRVDNESAGSLFELVEEVPEFGCEGDLASEGVENLNHKGKPRFLHEPLPSFRNALLHLFIACCI